MPQFKGILSDSDEEGDVTSILQRTCSRTLASRHTIREVNMSTSIKDALRLIEVECTRHLPRTPAHPKWSHTHPSATAYSPAYSPAHARIEAYPQ